MGEERCRAPRAKSVLWEETIKGNTGPFPPYYFCPCFASLTAFKSFLQDWSQLHILRSPWNFTYCLLLGISISPPPTIPLSLALNWLACWVFLRAQCTHLVQACVVWSCVYRNLPVSMSTLSSPPPLSVYVPYFPCLCEDSDHRNPRYSVLACGALYLKERAQKKHFSHALLYPAPFPSQGRT